MESSKLRILFYATITTTLSLCYVQFICLDDVCSLILSSKPLEPSQYSYIYAEINSCTGRVYLFFRYLLHFSDFYL